MDEPTSHSPPTERTQNVEGGQDTRSVPAVTSGILNRRWRTLPVLCSVLFSEVGEVLANHQITSMLIQLLQFKQLFIKCSTQRQQTSFTSKYIKFHQGKDLSKQLLFTTFSEQTAFSPQLLSRRLTDPVAAAHRPWGFGGGDPTKRREESICRFLQSPLCNLKTTRHHGI